MSNISRSTSFHANLYCVTGYNVELLWAPTFSPSLSTVVLHALSFCSMPFHSIYRSRWTASIDSFRIFDLSLKWSSHNAYAPIKEWNCWLQVLRCTSLHRTVASDIEWKATEKSVIAKNDYRWYFAECVQKPNNNWLLLFWSAQLSDAVFVRRNEYPIQNDEHGHKRIRAMLWSWQHIFNL